MNILIPIDFSNNSIQAAKFGLTHYTEANITLLYIVSVRQAGATMVMDINQELRVLNLKKMEGMVEELKTSFPNAKLAGKVEVGLFSETVVEEIENTEADALILGTKGASGIDEVLLGSNAYLAIKNAPIPLIVLNESYGLKPPKKILLASDFEGDLSDKVVQSLIDFKDKFGAELHVIHISDSGRGDNVKLKINHLIDDIVDRFHVIVADNIEDEIVSYAIDNQYDFIALAPKYRGIIKNLFHQSVTKKISASAKTPLLIMK